MIKKIGLAFRFCSTSSTTKTSTSSSNNIKEKLFETALHYVPKYGWNDRAIHAACGMLDLSPAAHRIISPF
jgi:ubiquinone biosynthesis protein COQ9